jgi:pectate lyase
MYSAMSVRVLVSFFFAGVVSGCGAEPAPGGDGSGGARAGTGGAGASSGGASSGTGGTGSGAGAGDATIRIDDPVPGWASQDGGTTGGGTDLAGATTVRTSSELASALDGGGIILLEPGTYDFPDEDGLRPQSNTTLIGTAPGALINGHIELRGVNNIIIRNIAVQGLPCSTFDECRAGEDAVQIVEGAHHIWLDHMDIYDGQDGNCDATTGSDFITISWSQFRYTSSTKEHAFSNLIAGSDGETESRGKLRMTYMYSWWGKGVRERQPRGRFGKVHVYNNYYNTDRSDGYVIGPGVEIQMIVENNQMDVPSVLEAFTDSFEDETTAYRATGNEGTAMGLNKEKGSVFQVPYDYALLPTAQVKGVVTAPSGGAGNTVTLAR